MDNKPGDYSVVLLRHVAGKGKVVTVPLVADLLPKGGFGNYNSIRAIADLEGDGKMELIVSSDYYEGQAAILFGYKSGKAVELAANGAGA